MIDSGIGMAEDQIERLFQPFVQADASITRLFGGTGLGLTLSKRLAVMLGGDLTVPVPSDTAARSASPWPPGRSIRPVYATTRPVRGPVPTLAAPATAVRLEGRILLAEDGADNQRLISLILEKAGAQVAVAQMARKPLKWL